MIDITKITEIVISLAIALVTTFLIPWIRSKTTTDQLNTIKLWVNIAVNAAEQLYTGIGRGAEKKAYVIAWLADKGLKIDNESLDNMIEAAVLELKNITAKN